MNGTKITVIYSSQVHYTEQAPSPTWRRFEQSACRATGRTETRHGTQQRAGGTVLCSLLSQLHHTSGAPLPPDCAPLIRSHFVIYEETII